MPSLNPWSNTVVTVITGPAVPPLPDSILAIDNGSAANAPTISHSGLCFANASGSSGYFSGIFLIELNAFDSLL